MSELLEVRGLARHFGGVRAVDGVDLTVAGGEVVGLVGPNGSGKSTLIDVVSGHLLPTTGTVWVDGTDVTGRPPHAIAAAGVARTYQRPRPFPQLSVERNVMMGAAFAGRGGSTATAREDAARWLEFVGLRALQDEPVSRLNLHQLKFLEMAKALATRPRLLLLDEVLSGLNPVEVDESVAMLGRIAGEGVTIVIVEHIIRVVVAICEKVVVLDNGKVIAQGAPDAVMSEPEVRTAYLGTKRA